MIATDLMGLLSESKEYEPVMPFDAVHGLDGVDDSLLVLVGAGGKACIFCGLQTVEP